MEVIKLALCAVAVSIVIAFIIAIFIRVRENIIWREYVTNLNRHADKDESINKEYGNLLKRNDKNSKIY